MKPRSRYLIQRLILRTDFFPLTYFYRTVYELSIRLASLLLRRVDGVVSVYLRRGLAKGEVVYGLSDIDLTVIVADDETGNTVKDRVKSIDAGLSCYIPLFGRVEEELGVYSISEFKRMYDDYDLHRFRFNEGRHTWRLLFGEDVVSALPRLEELVLRCLAAEELKVWWAAVNAELVPSRDRPLFDRKYLWYKAISELSKVFLFVCQGQGVQTREEALDRVRSYLGDEQRGLVDGVRGYIGHLTSREEVDADPLLELFIGLAAETLKEIEQISYMESGGKTAVLDLPQTHDLILDSPIEDALRRVQAAIDSELRPYLDSVAIIPQAEFGLDVLSNSDIDTLYLALVRRRPVPAEKLGRLLSVISGSVSRQRIEPFVVVENRLAFSLRAGVQNDCVKTVAASPLFFRLLPEGSTDPLVVCRERDSGPIRCELALGAFEETIAKRVSKIDAVASTRDIYKVRPLDFLRFFWAAARTKLLARSLEADEIHIPLNSAQIVEGMVESYPEHSDWLRRLHREYVKELAGEENESYRFYSRAIDLLKWV